MLLQRILKIKVLFPLNIVVSLIVDCSQMFLFLNFDVDVVDALQKYLPIILEEQKSIINFFLYSFLNFPLFRSCFTTKTNLKFNSENKFSCAILKNVSYVILQIVIYRVTPWCMRIFLTQNYT